MSKELCKQEITSSAVYISDIQLMVAFFQFLVSLLGGEDMMKFEMKRT